MLGCCEEGSEYIGKGCNGWFVQDDTYKYFDGINFCPFCGQNLRDQVVGVGCLSSSLNNSFEAKP